MIVDRKCDQCLNNYNADTRYLNRGQGKFCSRQCAGIFRVAQLEPLLPNVVCSYCETAFYLKESRIVKSKSGLFFCSKEHQTLGFSDPLISVKPGPKPSRTRSINTCKTNICLNKTRKEFCVSCTRTNTITQWLSGDNSITLGGGYNKDTKAFVKKYLIETRGDQCEVCGFSEKAPDGRSIIQMDHIDGNSQNNDLENLKLLCPNHHAMTPTYGSLNMGSGRAHRRKSSN